jgi:hypothetical protein
MRMTSCCRLKRNPFRSTNGTTSPARHNKVSNKVGRGEAVEVRWKSNRDGWIATNVYFVYIFFPSIVKMSFQTFQCQDICGVTYLGMDDREKCWVPGSRHITYSYIVALPALALYMIVLPLLALVYLRSHRKVVLTDRKIIFRFGLLFSGYSSSRWYWETVVIFRKLIFSVIVTVGKSYKSQLHFALGALIILLYLQERGRPFEEATSNGEGDNDLPEKMLTAEEHQLQKKHLAVNRLLHSMEIFSLLVLLTMVWVSVFFTLERCGSSDLTCIILSGVVFASNIFFIAYCGYTACKTSYPMLRKMVSSKLGGEGKKVLEEEEEEGINPGVNFNPLNGKRTHREFVAAKTVQKQASPSVAFSVAGKKGGDLSIIEMTTLAGVSTTGATSSTSILYAAYDYDSKEVGQISMRMGDELIVLENHVNDHWSRGLNRRTGDEGLFPLSYVHV